MPVTARKHGKYFRVVESESGNIAKNSSGTAVDGGGHKTKEQAMSQCRAINANKHG